MTETKPTAFTLKLNDVRLDRVSLAKPFVGEDSPIDPATGKKVGKYHADLILASSHPQYPKVKELMRAAVVAKFKDEAEQAITQMIHQDKLCVHHGDVTRAGKAQYAGKLYISASNDIQPNVVVTENGALLSTVDGTLTPAHKAYPYSGCHANVIVEFKAYNHPKGGKGVSCYLNGVQFLRHDVRTGGGGVAQTSEFGLVPSEADGAPPAQTASSGGDGLI
jgi:hypothetical protein